MKKLLNLLVLLYFGLSCSYIRYTSEDFSRLDSSNVLKELHLPNHQTRLAFHSGKKVLKNPTNAPSTPQSDSNLVQLFTETHLIFEPCSHEHCEKQPSHDHCEKLSATFINFMKIGTSTIPSPNDGDTLLLEVGQETSNYFLEQANA